MNLIQKTYNSGLNAIFENSYIFTKPTFNFGYYLCASK
ncbi:hypothetical protein LEP1GSC125_1140 [Leptospira mayottensis 200901122]|uniref:Uncharacterized protein n=1 Tax=Leptospira mayottensis 200901122 TaxID=1193010 RepID=A0AA87SXR5_9LEPT|nr:hypothetical protein LEP1GSC125_1140 [Leptospira mayottensis 200901122]